MYYEKYVTQKSLLLTGGFNYQSPKRAGCCEGL